MPETYIIHFEKPVWGHAQHYCGSTKFDSETRFKEHLSGSGSRMCKVALMNKIPFSIAYTEKFETYKEAYRRERQLKKERKQRNYCRFCKVETTILPC